MVRHIREKSMYVNDKSDKSKSLKATETRPTRIENTEIKVENIAIL